MKAFDGSPLATVVESLHSVRAIGLAVLASATVLGAGTAAAYTAPYSTPPGITLVDVSTSMGSAVPLYLWRRLGDANGNPLYTYDADQSGKSSCYQECAKEFPPLVAGARAKAAGDFSILVRDDHVRQWVYQGRPLYRYSGTDPVGEPKNNGAIIGNAADPRWFDPGSDVYSPKPGWRRAAYTPEKTIAMPPTVELGALAVANGFGFVDAATHLTVYAAPVGHQLSSDWKPLRASALAVPVGDLSIITRKDDGTRQWAYRGEALYTYAGDYTAGEVTGIFTGDHSIQAALVYRNFSPRGVEIRHYLGGEPLMTTAKGQALYYVARFYPLYGARETRLGYGITYNDAKSQGPEECQGECTKTYEPLLAGPSDQAGAFWEIETRADGSRQWAFKGSPVYTFVGDKIPGDITGNNRHVIVYGGPQGQIVYEDAGGDPRDVQPLIGHISMAIAEGPLPKNLDALVGGTADAGAGAAVNGSKKAAATLSGAARYRGAGAGLYWHTLGLFY